MHRGKTICLVLCLLLILLPCVAAGPGGYVTLINATPHDWALTYSHAYQIEWNPPKIIPAGTSHQQYVEFWNHWGGNGDCGAEASYRLVGSPQKASFQLQARQTDGKNIRIQYLDSLASVNNQRHSLINLGFEHDGSVLFVLAGDGKEQYVSSNPPPNWMQSSFSTIGSKPLREIALPASHNAGMSKADLKFLFGGTPHSTETQSLNMKKQLESGVRWFDIRPVHTTRAGWSERIRQFFVHEKLVAWHTGHFSKTKQGAVVGGAGQSLKEIVDSVNDFTQNYPGELIILDLSHELDSGKSVQHWDWNFTPDRWQDLYEIMGGIKDLWDTNSTILDYSSVPLSTFIQPGSNSTVLIRVPNHAPIPEGQTTIHDKLPISAFVSSSDLYFTGSYSDTEDADTLSKDQLEKLRDMRPNPQTFMHRSTWTITPRLGKLLDIGNGKNSIVGQSVHAHRKLFADLWPHLSKSTYPNLIEVDNINSQITALCMAINTRFARR